MDIEKYLILLKDKDETENVTDCKYNNSGYDVSFKSGKTYTYGYTNVKFLENTEELNPETTVIYDKEQCVSGIIKILRFEDYYRLIFKTGYKKLYHESEITIEKTCLENKASKNCFEYLKTLAEKINISANMEESFLKSQYDKIKIISPRSVLANYINPREIKKRECSKQIIFPFGFNLSQKVATENALTNEISVIEGPPGTGKTQTILNIIANAILNDKTVAVVSNNNSATANVLEKLKKYEVDFIAAYLGNKNNKKTFFEEQSGSYPDFNQWKLEYEDYEKIKNELLLSQKTLEQMLEKQNYMAKLKQELSSLDIEVEYFNQYRSFDKSVIKPYRAIFKHNSAKVMSFLVDYSLIIKRHGDVYTRHKIKILIKYGIFSFKFYKNASQDIADYLTELYYELRMKELKNEIEHLEKTLYRHTFEEEMKIYSEKSMILLKATLARKYSSIGSREIFSKEDLFKNFQAFIKEYPVILSTTHSLRSCASENYLFDYVIIDEASQVDIVTGALAFSCAKNVVVVGDLKQLPNVVPKEVESISNNIFSQYNLKSAYNYSKNSLLSSIISLYPNVPRVLLKEHYRCHPKIIDFCNKKFYDDQLVILTDNKEGDVPLVVYKTVKGNHARNKYNQRQIDVILQEVLPKLDSKESIGIASPYKKQVAELENAIQDKNIEIKTVHKYQGREKDTIILSTVANEADDFIDDPNLINVAVSRAKNKLILVVSDSDIESKDRNIGDLIRYIEYNNFEVINSNIYSVFDLLYSSYSEKLLEVLKDNKEVSEFASENLMNSVIEKVLEDEKFKCFDKVLHQPLKMLIRDTSKLNEKEYKFVMNSLTHTDFLIFNKIDKMPALVVEVDGYAFHANNPKQLERDKMKDEILAKYNIPILRIKTNESGEEKKLYDKLLGIV
ncbi:AAA domain-containing protein [Inconstantimicrobium mannanitabidum]|uniref:DNA helicase n=1 Tax=Inconstantimicrobium mannanitabidum TaxID=1604901 RepID=A0ACB5RFB8_9CLOT|nr:AAA domain-containing protein [Clostridium sp. TW13]GKX67682.1 DNA helicase [Clostridium sp. TW13]